MSYVSLFAELSTGTKQLEVEEACNIIFVEMSNIFMSIFQVPKRTLCVKMF